MMKPASTLFLCVAVSLVLAAGPAEARKRAKSDEDAPSAKAEKSKSDKKADKKSAPGKPVEVATFGDWGAYVAKGRSKTCYTLASPKERKPDVKRDAAYVFISDRPAEKVRSEVSIIMGFPMKENAPAQAKIGSTSFELVAKGSNAWIKKQADEAKFVETMKRSAKLVVKASPIRGAATTDTYVLTGFKQALERVAKECK